MRGDEARRLEQVIDLAAEAGDYATAEEIAERYVLATRSLPPSHEDGDGASIALSPWFRSRYLSCRLALSAGWLDLAARRTEELLANVADRRSTLPETLTQRLHLTLAESHARRAARAHGAHQALAQSLLAQAQASPTTELPDPAVRAWELRIRLALGEVAQLGDQLDAVLVELTRTGDWATAAHLVAEAARAWLVLGRLDQTEQALNQAEQLWSRAGSILSPDPARASSDLLRGRLAHLRGHWQSAIDAYERCERAASPAKNSPILLELKLRRVLLSLDLNQLDTARTTFTSAIEEWTKFPEELKGLTGFVALLLDESLPSGVEDSFTDVAENRAFHSARRGEWAEAMAVYREAWSRLGESGGGRDQPEHQARMALSLGMVAHELNQRGDAAAWLGRAREIADAHSLPEVRWRARIGLGILEVESTGDEAGLWIQFEEAAAIAEGQGQDLRSAEARGAFRRLHGDAPRHLLRAAAQRGDLQAVFRFQEMARGRYLLDLWQATAWRSGPGKHCPEASQLETLADEIAKIDDQLKGVRSSSQEREPTDTELSSAQRALGEQRGRLVARRDRVWDQFLARMGQQAGSGSPLGINRDSRAFTGPPGLLGLDQFRKSLAPGDLYLAAWWDDRGGHDPEVMLLAVRRDSFERLIQLVGGREIQHQLEQFESLLREQLERYRWGMSLSVQDRERMDEALSRLGEGPLGTAIFSVLAETQDGGCPANRLIWAADGPLHRLPIGALRRDRAYLIERSTVVNTLSGSFHARLRATPKEPWWRQGRRREGLIVAGTPDQSLRFVQDEGRCVSLSFRRSTLLEGAKATKKAVRDRWSRARAVHFACHADLPVGQPRAARIELPSGEEWSAAEWVEETGSAGIPLVTLSACRSAELAELFGRDVFGLVGGVLAAGVHAVVAGLWSVPDRETRDFMARFYRHLMRLDPAEALAQTQRDAILGCGPESHPLSWGVFVLQGDPDAWPRPPRWLDRWTHARQESHRLACLALP